MNFLETKIPFLIVSLTLFATGAHYIVLPTLFPRIDCFAVQEEVRTGDLPEYEVVQKCITEGVNVLQ